MGRCQCHDKCSGRRSLNVCRGGWPAAGLLAVGAVSVLVGFDSLFRKFHVLSFANDFWLLDPRTDHLVQMFPQNFWFDVTLAAGIATIAEGAVLALVGFAYVQWLDYRERHRDERESRSTSAATEAID